MCSKVSLYFLLGQPGFYLQQKQRYSVWKLIENASFISFHGRIWPRYSEISLKEAKAYLSKNNKNTKKIQVSKAISSIRRRFASQDIHDNSSVNTKMQKQNET